MTMRTLAAGAFLALAVATQACAGELVGPGRFCGYSAIIDLAPEEKVTTLAGGVHGGDFRWEGPFGSLDVYGTGWASRPKRRMVSPPSGAKPARFAEQRVDGRYEVAIWNGAHGAAYFRSTSPLTPSQLAAIGRIVLFEEGETPSGCNLRAGFSRD